MSILSIPGTGRVPASNADTSAPVQPTRRGAVAPAIEIDQVTQLPMPPRFPWLSRLSQELSAAAKQRPAFPAASILGDRLDKSA